MARAGLRCGGIPTTARASPVVCLVLVGIFAVIVLLPARVLAPPPIPMRTDGQAFNRTGSPLPSGTPIRTFVDGVDYSDDPVILNGIGSFTVLTAGNSKTNANVSDTPTIQEGANTGDAISYAAGDFTNATAVFKEVSTWSPDTVKTLNLNVGATTSQPVKIQGLVTRPARAGNQYVYLCNPTAAPVSLSDYYLELDAPGTYHGATVPLSGVLNATSKLREDLPSPTWLTPTGDAVKLVYRNPGGPNASANGLPIVVDRVEFNASRGGTLDWEPGNTIMGDAPAPGIGRILERDANCTDTNEPTDFSVAIEPGLPGSSNLTVLITSPAEGQAIPAATSVTFLWTVSDDIFATTLLQVWANVTIGNQTTPLIAGEMGVTSVAWNTPDLVVDNAIFRVEVADPFGAHASVASTFSLTRQSPLALIVAVLIAVVLAAFVLIAFLRSRKKKQPPISSPPSPPPAAPAPAVTPPVAPPVSVPESTASKKVCPRCHTAVNAGDLTCFFCGYKFPEERKPLP